VCFFVFFFFFKKCFFFVFQPGVGVFMPSADFEFRPWHQGNRRPGDARYAYFLFLFCFLLFSTFLACVEMATLRAKRKVRSHTGLPVKEDAFLLNLRMEHIFQVWTHNDGWDAVETEPDKCYGIDIGEVEGGMHVRRLDLSNNNLQGRVARVNEKGWLRHTLYEGHGQLPESLGNLRHLTVLQLSQNFISGEIPESIKCCVVLQILDMSNNDLMGEIPNGLVKCTELRVINLTRNNLVGALPEKIGNLAKLQLLDASRNKLTGRIPESLGECEALRCLRLTRNNFKGHLYDSLGRLSNLVCLRSCFPCCYL
jgi:hypothetical protein